MEHAFLLQASLYFAAAVVAVMAAHRLGLNPTTLYGKMRKHAIKKNEAGWE